MEQTELVVRDGLHGRHGARLLVGLAMSAVLVACSSDGSGVTQASRSTPPTAVSTRPTDPGPTDPGPTDPAPTDPAPTDPAGTDPVPSTAAELPLAAPAGDAFYVPPEPVPGTANGDLIWARTLDGAPAGTAAWQVLYRSESVGGEPIAVSGVVIGPATTSASAPRPVLTWAHGTTGLADRCAPSRAYGGGGLESVLAQAVVTLGFTFVATDYEGLGTPGVHPYLVGQSEGRGVLDIVRAAAQLDGSGASLQSQVAIFGHSQGGHAALMAAELAGSYAPELDVVGTVAAAPPGDIALIQRRSVDAGEALTQGFGLMLDAGFAAAYPDLPVTDLVDDEGVAVLDEIADTCTSDAFVLAEAHPGIQRDATTNADWQAAFTANSPGHVAPSAPVLIVHGSADVVVPPILSELIERDYCDLDVEVQRIVYEGADHGTVITAGLATVQSWIAARLAGAPAPTSC